MNIKKFREGLVYVRKLKVRQVCIEGASSTSESVWTLFVGQFHNLYLFNCDVFMASRHSLVMQYNMVGVHKLIQLTPCYAYG